jgi:cytochrome c biogenesis protein CcmG/thiol:disulfide interchange protein DsbE
VNSGAEQLGLAPVADAKKSRSKPADRPFQLIALVAGVCLIGFIIYIAVRPATNDHRTLGIAALKVPPPAVLHAGTVAPAFTLPRLGGGAPVSLTAFRGAPVIISFFASWCPHCRSELAAMGSIARQNNGHVAVVGVDSNDGAGSAAERLLVAANATYPVGLDVNAQVASRYLLTALPVTYFLDARGRVVGSALGAQGVASLERWVARLTAAPS